MKLLFICSRIPYPLKDGGAIATNQMIQGLAQAGHEVSILSLNTNKHFVSKEVIDKQFDYCQKVHTIEINTDIKIGKAFINLFTSASFNLSRFWDDEFLQLIQNEIDSNSYNVVQFEGLFVAEYATCIKSSIPLVLRQHNVEHQIWERLAYNEKNFLKSLYLKLLANRMKKFELNVFSSFDSIIAISKIDALYFKKYFSKKLITIPVSVEVERSNQIDKSSIYHIGSMEWLPNREGVQWFIKKVWKRVLKSIPDAHFYVAGKGIQSSDYVYAENITICGEVDSLKEFTKDKKLLIVPLLSGGGIRVKIIEAMANGKLVVSTSQGVQGLEEGYNIPISNDPEGFAKHIIELLQSKSIDAIESNYQYINTHFNKTELTSKLEGHYKSLL